MNTTNTTTAVELAGARVTELEAQHRAAQQESERTRKHADSLPHRLAVGDEDVTTDDLVQAGPTAAIAAAKAAAVARELTEARAVLEEERAVELAALLRSGEPFVHQDQVDKDLDRIAAYVLRELRKLGSRIEAHNMAFTAVTGALPRGAERTVQAGMDVLTVHHQAHGKTIALDDREWWQLSVDGWGQDILQRVELGEAQTRDAGRVPSPVS